MNRYQVLAVVAMIAVPLAPAVLFGWNLYLYLLGRLVPPWLAIAGGLAGAVSLELVGILAGHVGTVYLKKRDWRVIFPVVAMLFYVWFGWTKTPEYGGIFVLAALVYLLASLQNETAEEAQQAAAVTAVRQSFDLEQEAADREMDRTIRKERELAKIAARYSQPATQTSAKSQPATQPASLYECACGQVYEKPQSYSAHTRSCAVHRRVAANGHLQETA